VIVAGSGDDQIYGGPGADQITTGPGSDLIWYTGAEDAGDTIADFTPGQDKAVLYPVLDGQMTTAQAFAGGFFSIGASGNDTLLMFDSDGGAGPGAQIMLADFLSRSPADFDLARDFV
jgi:Ca2+-binding RTX toxin-like protein